MENDKPSRILVVDDDDETRSLFQNFLEYEGYNVDTCGHPSDIQVPEQYAVIIMDIHFGGPKLDGIDWVQTRRSDGLPVPRIVYATGFNIDRATVQKPDELLLKPIELTALRKILAEGA